jgi:uncharacterized protein (TIGR02453 family)
MKDLLTFLQALKENNTREWFQENKVRYDIINQQHQAFVGQLIQNISIFDTNIALLKPKDCVFRIYRDVRFSANKAPYKTAIGAVFSKGGRKSGNAGYYLHLEPDNSFIGGGIWRPDSAALKSIRYEIFNSPDELKTIVNEPSFKNIFDGLEGEKLQRPPKDFPADFEHIDMLKHKSYIVSHPLSNDQVSHPDLLADCSKIFHVMKPFISFLNRAIENA